MNLDMYYDEWGREKERERDRDRKDRDIKDTNDALLFFFLLLVILFSKNFKY